MQSDLHDYMHQVDFDEASVKYVAERLPADDAELDRDIEQASRITTSTIFAT